MSVPCFINIRISNFLFHKHVTHNIISNLFYYYLLCITFYSKITEKKLSSNSSPIVIRHVERKDITKIYDN